MEFFFPGGIQENGLFHSLNSQNTLGLEVAEKIFDDFNFNTEILRLDEGNSGKNFYIRCILLTLTEKNLLKIY